MQPAFDEQSEGVICKYCFESQKTSKATFITPCKCKNPICSECFNTRQSIFLDPTKCEICHAVYNGPYVIRPELAIQVTAPVDNSQHDTGFNILKAICICFFGCFIIIVLGLIMFGVFNSFYN